MKINRNFSIKEIKLRMKSVISAHSPSQADEERKKIIFIKNKLGSFQVELFTFFSAKKAAYPRRVSVKSLNANRQ